MQRRETSTPAVWLVGDVEQRDFADAVALLGASANLASGPPEVIIVAQGRAGNFRLRELNRLRQSAPLAGVVSLLGSWCEGELRTGKPLPGATRLYWYEFPSWWRRQLALCSAGCCPDWVLNSHAVQRTDCRNLCGAIVAIAAADFETTAAIGNVVQAAKGRFFWCRDGQRSESIPTADAGLWIGGQLNDAEAGRLADFCSQLAQRRAPVVALLDFPRQDRVVTARNAGAAAVLGMPWNNLDLIDELLLAMNGAESTVSGEVHRAA